MAKVDNLGVCLCMPEGAVVVEILYRVYLVVDSSVFSFIYVQFLSSFDHSVMQ